MMTYNGINFLLSGNQTVKIPPTKLFTMINPKGKIKLNEELYDLQEELEENKKKLVALFDKIIDRYAVRKMEGDKVVTENGKTAYEMEDSIENGKPIKRFKMEDREGYEKEIQELFDTKIEFKSKLSPGLLDGIELIGQVEYRWLRELDLLKK